MIINKDNTISKKTVKNINSSNKVDKSPIYSFFEDMVDYVNDNFDIKVNNNYEVEDYFKEMNLFSGNTFLDSESSTFSITSDKKSDIYSFINKLNKLIKLKNKKFNLKR